MIRNIFIVIATCAFCGAAFAGGNIAKQEAFVISYGDVTTDVEDADIEATGWRIDLLFEAHQNSGNSVNGLGIGYIETTAEQTIASQTSQYELKSLPIYYEGKMLFGDKAFKGLLKGALGAHYSEYERSGTLGSVSTDDFGFYGGISAGATYAFGEKVFVNLEYEFNYLSNSYYRDGYMESIIFGIGFKM
jgi:hypothetical protein